MSDTAKRLSARHKNDPDALIYAHLPLVRRLAWHVHGRISSSEALEELVQAGMVALVEAARVFEDRGFEFSTYASVRIKGAMIDHLRRGAGQSRGASASRRAIDGARRAAESAKGGAVTTTDIAAQLGVPIATYHRMATDACQRTVESLDDLYADDNPVFSDPAESAADLFDRNASETALRTAIEQLDARSQRVLQLYFFEELNLEEIGRVLDIGAARVCQIKKAALDRLRCGAPSLAIR